MHQCGTDSCERKMIPLLLAGASVALAYLLNYVDENTALEVPWWVDAPSVVGFYGLLYAAFDRWLWNWNPLRRIGLVQTPYIGGNWKGSVISSYDGHEAEYGIEVTIHQRWSAISIGLKTVTSSSYSRCATFITSSIPMVLSYEYTNKPRPDAAETMHTHDGTARFEIADDELEGEYYTARDRVQFGSIHLRRTP